MAYPIITGFPLSMAKGLKKSPVYNTVIQKVATGRGSASVSLSPFPTWAFEFDLDSIQGNEALATSTVSKFLGAYMACGGRNGLFLFTDPQDNQVSYTNSAMLNTASSTMATTGDGTTTTFQLCRTIGGVAQALDEIQNVNGTITVKVNGTSTTAFSLSSTGVITFTTAPAAGASLQWSGGFYFLCRFAEDTLDSTRTFTANTGLDLWDISSIKFQSELI
jgi:uncharacterized protein (TIGR02217 family)